MQQSANRQPRNAGKVRDNPATFSPITIAPNHMESLPLGRYRDAEPEPEFSFQYSPDIPRSITHELIKLPIVGSMNYVLSCRFQSFHDAPITVTVQRRDQRQP